MLRRRLKTLLATSLALAAITTTTSTAAASGEPTRQPAAPQAPAGISMISRDIYLTETAHTGTAYLPATGARAIRLAAGDYRFSVYLSNSIPASRFYRDVRIPFGDYKWRCYLSGTGVPWSETNYNYAGNCLLDPDNPDLPNIWLPTPWPEKILWRRYKGTFYWESKLEQL